MSYYLESDRRVRDLKTISGRAVLSTLNFQEQEVLLKRMHNWTYVEIGASLVNRHTLIPGITRARIMEIHSKALRKLRHPGRRRMLEKATDDLAAQLLEYIKERRR